MSEYTFDASLTVEADSTEEAENLILDHLMDADIACSLYVDGTLNVKQLQRKYEALVRKINSAQSHTAETLRLLQWDQLGWDVPEEVIESLGKADSELRTLLENDDE